MNHAEIASMLPDADALVLVPPFMSTFSPALGPHMIQAHARGAGFRVGVYYASMEFAARIGENLYLDVPQARPMYTGEQLFAAAAYGTPPMGRSNEEDRHNRMLDDMAANSKMENSAEIARVIDVTSSYNPMSPVHIDRIERATGPWADDVARAVAEKDYKVVGCTTMFYQTAASVALLNRIKRIRPGIITVIGGANCEGEMAEGIVSLGASIDTVFSGESEIAFTDFLRRVMDGEAVPGPIVEGGMCLDLESLPAPDYSEFFEQHDRILPTPDGRHPRLDITYEVSRGCWWGEKSKCKFCGFNGARTPYRVKSPDKVVRELNTILEGRRVDRVRMADNIMPKERLPELMAKLADEGPSIKMYYEARPTLSLRDVLAMRRAGIVNCQAGIESLSTSLLRKMGKGMSTRINVAFLRYARVADMYVHWNLLWGFPGDEAADFEETLDLIPLLRHLPPAANVFPLHLARFSVYHNDPEKYGITNIRPRNAYARFLPPQADATKLDRHFVADFECGSFANLDLIMKIFETVKSWQGRWETVGMELFREHPRLEIRRESDGRYRLLDTRALPGTQRVSTITRSQAEHALVARGYGETADAKWALDSKVAVVRNHWLVPLATAEADLLLEFEDEYARSKRKSK